jgi:hypothetical protein
LFSITAPAGATGPGAESLERERAMVAEEAVDLRKNAIDIASHKLYYVN